MTCGQPLCQREEAQQPVRPGTDRRGRDSSHPSPAADHTSVSSRPSTQQNGPEWLQPPAFCPPALPYPPYPPRPRLTAPTSAAGGHRGWLLWAAGQTAATVVTFLSRCGQRAITSTGTPQRLVLSGGNVVCHRIKVVCCLNLEINNADEGRAICFSETATSAVLRQNKLAS